MAITELKLSSLRKVVGDKDFINEEDEVPYTMSVMTRCYDDTEFQYKDANNDRFGY